MQTNLYQATIQTTRRHCGMGNVLFYLIVC